MLSMITAHLTKILGGLAAVLALATLTQSCRLAERTEERDLARTQYALCQEINRGTKADIKEANEAAEACLHDLQEQRRRRIRSAAEAEAEREERTNALRDRIRRLQAALEDSRESGNPCSGRLLPHAGDSVLRAGTPYEDGDGDGGGDQDGGGPG